jgi:methylmalonyl-CoA mutase C-terminal domain/subunit
MKKSKILLAKMGLDCHDTGIITVEAMLRKEGYQVSYLGLHNSAEKVVSVAIEDQVDAIGVSFLSGQHMTQMKILMTEIERRKLVTKVVCGGVIPADDAADLKKMGVLEVVTPGTLSREVVDQVERALAAPVQANVA